MYCNIKSWKVVKFKYENVAYYHRKHWTGFLNGSIWGPPLVLCLWVSYFWVNSPWVPSSPFNLMDLNQWRAPLSVESLLSGVLLSWHPDGRPLCFFHLLSSCSSAPLSMLSRWYYLPVTHSLPPSFCTFFMKLTSLLQNLIWVESHFVNAQTHLCTHREAKARVPLFFHFSVMLRAEWSVSVCFLADWHGINCQASCFWNWHRLYFINTTQLVKWEGGRVYELG